MLRDELSYFITHQEELVSQYQGKVLVIKNQTVIGVHETILRAYLETQKTEKLGTFLIQKCAPGLDAYTMTISSLAITV